MSAGAPPETPPRKPDPSPSAQPAATTAEPSQAGEAAAAEWAAGDPTQVVYPFILVTDDGRRVEVPPGRRYAGRDPEADLSIKSERASWRHAVLVNLYGQLWIEDLGSTNGTFVNGQRVRSVALRAGDAITIGSTRIQVERPAGRAEDDPESRAVAVVAAVSGERLPGALIYHSRPEAHPASGFDVAMSRSSDPHVLRRRMAALYRLAGLLAEAEDAERLGETVLDLVLFVFCSDRAFFLEVLPDGSTRTWLRRRPEPSAGSAPASLAAAEPQGEPSQSIVRQVIQQKVAMATIDAGRDQRFRGALSIFGQGIRSAICAPVWQHGKVSGAIYVDSLVEHCVFTQDDLVLLEAIASQSGLGLLRMQALADLKEHARTIERQRGELARMNASLEERVERQTEALRARAHELLELQEARRVFAELVAHDLRNPLTPLDGNLAMLKRKLGDQPGFVELVDEARAAVGVLDGLIKDLVDTMDLEQERLVPERQRVELCALCEGIVKRHSQSARDCELLLNCRVPTDTTALLDPRLITRTIENLVTNSMRYVPAGGQVWIENGFGPEGELELAVVDTGPGIPEEARARVFDPFVRLDEGAGAADPTRPGAPAASRAAHRGAHRGLGLYFCRLAVEAHGGRIWVEGGPGNHRVVVRLPKPPPAAA